MGKERKSRAYTAVAAYVRALRWCRFIVIGFWLAVLGTGVKYAFNLLDKVTDSSSEDGWNPPSLVAAEHLSAFPVEVTGRPMAVIVSTIDGSNITSHMGEIDAAARRMQTHYCIVRVETPDMIWSTTQIKYDTVSRNCGSDPDRDSRPKVDGDPMVYNTLFSRLLNVEDNLVMMAIRTMSHHQEEAWFQDLIDNLPQANTTASKLLFVTTGNGLVTDPIMDHLEHDLILGDAISIPSALLILCLTLRSARYAPIPILSIGLSILSSFLLVLAIASPREINPDGTEGNDPKTHVSSVAPNLMMSVSIAMSVDYSLFFLSRWNEEVRAGVAILEATTITMYHTGHTIVVSGVTLAACAMGLMLIPMDLLSSLGFSCSIVVVCTMLINLTLTPALLLWNPCNLFGGVYTSAKNRGCCSSSSGSRGGGGRNASSSSASTPSGTGLTSSTGGNGNGNGSGGGDGVARGIQRRNAAKAMAKQNQMSKVKGSKKGFMATFANNDDDGVGNNDDDALLAFDPEADVVKVEEAAGDAPTEQQQMEQIKKTRWYRFGDWLTSKWRPYITIVLITGLSAALAKMSLTFDVVGGNALCYSRGSAHNVWLEVGDVFGYSDMLPNAMLFQNSFNSSTAQPLSVVEDFKTLYAAVAEIIPAVATAIDVDANQIQTFNYNMTSGDFGVFPSTLKLLACVSIPSDEGEPAVATVGDVGDVVGRQSSPGGEEAGEGASGSQYARGDGVHTIEVEAAEEEDDDFGPRLLTNYPNSVFKTVGRRGERRRMDNGVNDVASLCKAEIPDCTEFCDQLTRYIYIPGINPPSDLDPLKVKMVVEVGIDDEPLSAAGFQWLEDARAAFDQTLSSPKCAKVEGWLGDGYHGGFDARFDMINRVYTYFPLTAAFVAAIVFVLMGITFGSVVIAVKAVVSIALTLSLVYGIVTAVYQNGILESLHSAHFISLQPTAGGLCWVPPVLCFCLLVGLGLDYHIFLLNRVMEFRLKGFTDRESVILGLAKTGGVITAAGLIMAVAFLGTFFAGEPVLQQLSFFIIIAVLVDTFVVRAMLVPSMMVTLGKYNWWPRKMPTTQEAFAAIELEDQYNSL